VVVGHGVRERQVRGPLAPDRAPEVVVVRVRRYRCRRCGAVMTVLPRELLARRYYSASAIGLAFGLYGLGGCSQAETRRRVSPWRILGAGAVARWAALRHWSRAVARRRLFVAVRPCPPDWTLRRRAERVAATLVAYAPAELGTAPVAVRVFAAAALAA
jgi:hypothetical protein